MKRSICGVLLVLSLLGVFAAVGWLEADAISYGQALLLGLSCEAGMAWFGHIGGYMEPYQPHKKKKRPARRQPCKAMKKTTFLKYTAK